MSVRVSSTGNRVVCWLAPTLTLFWHWQQLSLIAVAFATVRSLYQPCVQVSEVEMVSVDCSLAAL